MELKCLEENYCERSIEIKGKDERSSKVMKNIQDLDVSVQELEQQLKMIRAESLDFQLKNCEELKNKLATEAPSESDGLAKNTQRFLELFAAEEKNQESSDKCKKHIRRPKLTQENNEPQISMSMTDEEKQTLNLFTSDSIVDPPVQLNPYSLDESSKKLLKEIEDKLEKLDRR